MKRILIVVSIALLAVCCVGCSSQQATTSKSSSSSVSSSSKSSAAPQNVDELVVTNFEIKDQFSHYFDAVFTFKNNTDSTIVFDGFDVVEMDSSGKIIDSYKSYNKNASQMGVEVEPGQEISVDLTEDSEDGIAKIKVSKYTYKNAAGIRVEGKLSEPYIAEINL